jgi:site-specific recombinase XerD
MYKITTALIDSYHSYLIDEEKAPATISKYVRDVQVFVGWLKTRDLDKSAVLAYKSYLIESYAPASVNAAISSLNYFANGMDFV